MKYLKKFERIPEWRQTQLSVIRTRKLAFEEYKKEYEKYFNKFVIVKFKKTGRLDMYKILGLDQEFDLEEYPYLDAIKNYPDNNERSAITITNIDILEAYDNLEDAKYNFNLMFDANKYNI